MTEERTPQSEHPELIKPDADDLDEIAAQAEEAKALLRQDAQEQGQPTAEEQVADAIQRLPTEPLTVESRAYRSTDQTTDFDELIAAFPKKFTKVINVRGITMTLVCNRVSAVDIFDDDDDVDPNVLPNTKEIYKEAVTVICKVVDTTLTPEQLESKLEELPASLVTRMSREIMKEISPRWQDDNASTEED